MSRWLAVVALALVASLVACASGSTDWSQADGRINDRFDSRVPDQWTPPADVWVWPDHGAKKDLGVWPQPDTRARDLAAPPDAAVKPDSKPPVNCPDTHETNESCNVSKYLGSTKEGGSWPSTKGTINPGSDVDWYRAKGAEESHTCLPFTSQKYYFRVRLTVPAGRALRVCLYKESCGGGGYCASNTVKTTASQLNVNYKVSGTCALNDDTTAYFKVESTDGKGGCVSYTVAYNYND